MQMGIGLAGLAIEPGTAPVVWMVYHEAERDLLRTHGLEAVLREQIVAAMMSQMVAQWDEWMRVTKGTGVQIIEVPAEDAKGGAA